MPRRKRIAVLAVAGIAALAAVGGLLAYWLKPDGSEMTNADWHSGHARALGMVLPGDQITEVSEVGTRIVGDTFILLFNAEPKPIPFRLGTRSRDNIWECVLDTGSAEPARREFAHASTFPLHAHSLAVLCSKTDNYATT